jgi:hypothetical protein
VRARSPLLSRCRRKPGRLNTSAAVEQGRARSGVRCRRRYAVRPNGGVAMMHLDAGTEVVDNFGPDGKRESSIPLERPPIPLFPMQIAVFRSGEILIAGLQFHPGYKAG